MKIYDDSDSVVNFVVKRGIFEYIKVETILKTDFDISSRLFSKLIRNQGLYLNGVKAHRKDRVKTGDIITIFLEDEEDETIKQSEIPLEIIYEDLDLILINKQPDMVVHPTKNHPYGTISNALSYYFQQNNINKKARFANRLDRDTSGILVIAKNSFAHQQMSKQFIEDTVEKGYIALVDGLVEKEEDTIDLPIEREEEGSIKRIVRPDGKQSITKYKVLERYKNTSLLKIKLETGRTHQIRVHLKHIGHPIIGDSLYNSKSNFIERQALHSHRLKFETLRTKEIRDIEAKLPQDIKQVIDIAKVEKI